MPKYQKDVLKTKEYRNFFNYLVLKVVKTSYEPAFLRSQIMISVKKNPSIKNMQEFFNGRAANAGFFDMVISTRSH